LDKHLFVVFFFFSLSFFYIDESRPFTIDAMLNNNGKNLNKENSQQQGMSDMIY